MMPYQEFLLEVNRNLDLLAPGVKKLVMLAVAECHREGLPIAVFEGWRSPERQLQLYMGSKTVTRAAPGLSFHQFGLACDVAFYDPDWNWVGDWPAVKKIFMSHGFDSPPSFEEGHFQVSNGWKATKIKELVEHSTLQAAWIAMGVDA